MQAAEIEAIAVRAVEIYVQKNPPLPQPSHVTCKQAAEMLGVHSNTVTGLLRTGKLKLNGIGKIPVEQVNALLRARD